MSPSTLNYDFPFPDGDSPVLTSGDFERLAKALDSKMFQLLDGLLDKSASPLGPSSPIDSLPNGIYTVWNGGVAEALGLPNNSQGVVISIRYGARGGMQIWVPRLFGAHELWIRNSLSDGWTDWGEIGAGGGISSASSGTTTSGFKTVPLALTRGNGGGSTAETSAAVRYPIQYNADITRWRLHIVDGNPRFNLRKTTGINLRSIYLMPYNSAGTPSDRITLVSEGPDKDEGSRDDLVTEWFDEPIGGNVGRYISIAYQATAPPVALVGGCYVNPDWNANDSTSMSGFSKRTSAPFDIWIEAETASGTPVIASLGDSNSVGVGTDLPLHDDYLSVYCRRIGALPVHYGHSGDSLQHWEEPDEEKWNRFASLSPADAVLQMMGSNDMGGTPSFEEMKRRFQVVTDIAAQKISPIVHIGLIKPRTNGSSGYQSLRLQYNDFLKTMPPPAREVHDLSSPVANSADTEILSQYDADGTHMNTAGHLLLARSISDPITRHVDQDQLTTFQWTGTADASESVMKVGGAEERRNLYPDPKLTDPEPWASADTLEAMTWDSSWTGNANSTGFSLSGEGAVHAELPVDRWLNVSEGQTITLGLNVAALEGFEARPMIYWYDGTTFIGSSGDAASAIPSNGDRTFERSVISGDAPEGATAAGVSVWVKEGGENPVSEGAAVYLDGLTLERGETDGAYFDGDTEGWDRLDRPESVQEQELQLTDSWRTDVSSEVNAYRTGNVVTVAAWRLSAVEGATGEVDAYSLPPGYRPARLTQNYGEDSRGARVMLSSSGLVRVTNPSGSVSHHSFTFVTLDDPIR